jgi:hypothetical protein
MDCDAAMPKFALLIRKNWQDLPPFYSMISNNFNRRWLTCEETRASEPIIGIFQ